MVWLRYVAVSLSCTVAAALIPASTTGQAPATAPSSSNPPTVLFMCPHGAAKSVLASAYFQRLAKERGLNVRVESAGTEPDAEVAPVVASHLSRNGYAVPISKPRAATRADLESADVVISIGCDLTKLPQPRGTLLKWDDIPAPSQDFAAADDAIRKRVGELVEELIRKRQGPGPEAEVIALIEKDQPFTMVPALLFHRLGWELPDGGAAVKALATAAPGGAFDPKAIEALSPDKLGYRAKWHVSRYTHYGLPWDITGLYLEPVKPAPRLPVLVYINGGSANFYEFFVDPLQNPGLGQYLAQRIPVLLVSIPGNYRHGGWPDPIPKRRPQYVLDRDLGDEETRVRNAIFTNTLIAEGVTRLIDAATRGPVLISGHSTSGELQYILKERLNDRLRGFSFGWGTGGPAWVRGSWEGEAADARNRGTGRKYPPVTEVRARDAQSYSGGYLGPLNPIAGGSRLEIAQKWLDLESRRRPWFKQAIQDIEHTASVDRREEVERTIRQVVSSSQLPVDAEAVIKDLFATMRSPITGYRRMIWTAALLDDGHWDPDPAKARELFVANRFREKNPGAAIRVLVYDVPMTHYGHIERPKELAGGTLAAVKWLVK